MEGLWVEAIELAAFVELDDAIGDLGGGEGIGVDFDGVFGFGEGGEGAVAVLEVSLGDRGFDLFEIGGPAAPSEVVLPPSRSLLNGGGEENFEFGLGKDVGADVATFGNEAAFLAVLALLAGKEIADGGLGGDRGDAGSDFGAAEVAARVFAIDVERRGVGAAVENDVAVADEFGNGGAIVDGNPLLENEPGDGAVGGSGVEVEQAELLGYAVGDGGFSSPGGSVDGNDGLAIVQQNVVDEAGVGDAGGNGEHAGVFDAIENGDRVGIDEFDVFEGNFWGGGEVRSHDVF